MKVAHIGGQQAVGTVDADAAFLQRQFGQPDFESERTSIFRLVWGRGVGRRQKTFKIPGAVVKLLQPHTGPIQANVLNENLLVEQGQGVVTHLQAVHRQQGIPIFQQDHQVPQVQVGKKITLQLVNLQLAFELLIGHLYDLVLYPGAEPARLAEGQQQQHQQCQAGENPSDYFCCSLHIKRRVQC